MDEMTRRDIGGLARLDGLAAEIRTLSENVAVGMLQLGRALSEAKGMVPHGEFGAWLEKNTALSERSAQQFMAAWRRFGNQPLLQGVDKSKLFKMLALPDGAEEKFLSENDISAMTAREVGEAVKRAREEERARADEEIAREREGREAAEERVRQLAAREPEIPQKLTDELRWSRSEIERLANMNQDSLDEAIRLRREKAELERDLREQEALMEAQQEAVNQAQAELLNLQSMQARGDAEREIAEDLTLDVFSVAVERFIGKVARMPRMGRAFAAMPEAQREAYETLLETVEEWAAGAKTALRTLEAEWKVPV